MHIVINKNIRDVYLDLTCQEFLRHMFKKCIIYDQDANQQKIVLDVTYKTNILDAYQNDALNLLKSLCLIDKIEFNIEQKIFPFKHKFILCYLMNIKNYHQLPFIPFLDTLKALFVLEFEEVSNDKTCCSVLDIQIDHNLTINIDKIKHSDMKQNEYVLDIFDYNDMLKLYKKQQKNFFKSEYDIKKDVVVNFVNMLLNDCIRHAYLKKLCKYYCKKNINLWLKKYKDMR